MKFIGNLLWFLLCGLVLGLVWALAGLLWCVTIIGIPVGLQCFKLARLSLWPFGYDVELSDGAMPFIVNVLWLIFGGVEITFISWAIGLVLCVTIIGIPFGKQCFKLGKLALLPFGARIVPR